MAPTFDIPLGSSKTSAKRTSPAIRMRNGKHPPLQVSQEFQIHVKKTVGWLLFLSVFRRLPQHGDYVGKVVMVVVVIVMMTVKKKKIMMIKIMTLAHPVS